MPATPTPPPSLIPSTEAARRLDVHPRTLRRIRQRGEIEHVRVGRGIKFTEAALVAYIQTQTVVERAHRRTAKRRRRA